MMRLVRLAHKLIVVASIVPVASAQDEWAEPEFVESYFKEIGRGDRHSPGWEEILALKGEPLPPRFPEVGRGIERYVLDNGLVVYLAPQRDLPLLRAGFAFRAGKSYESDDESGLAAELCRRMQGGAAGPRTSAEMAARLDLLSIQIQARAGNESSGVTLDALSEHADDALELFRDLIRRPKLRGGGGGGGPQVQGFAGGGGRPRGLGLGTWMARMQFRSLMSGRGERAKRDPPGRSALERFAAYEGFSRADLLDAHAFYVRPENGCLAVSGDFEIDAMRAQVEELFGDWPSSDEPLPERVEREVPPIESDDPGLYVIDVEGLQSAVVIGHAGVEVTEDRHAIALMNRVLGGGSFSSRITERVRSDEGLAYSASSTYLTMDDLPSYFQVTAQTRTDTTARVIELILDEVHRIREPGTLSRNEYETAREATLYSYGRQFTDAAENVARLMRHELEGRAPDHDRVEYDRLAAVTPQDIEAAAVRHIRPDELFIVVVGDLDEIRASLERFGPIHVVDPLGRRR